MNRPMSTLSDGEARLEAEEKACIEAEVKVRLKIIVWMIQRLSANQSLVPGTPSLKATIGKKVCLEAYPSLKFTF